MSESWKTKWGTRRVRHDPPTLAEAFAAAACLTEDRRQQAEIAAELMGVTIDIALAEAERAARDQRGTITVAATSRDKARLRTVVIERRPSRRLAPGRSPEPSAVAGPDPSGATSRLPPTARRGAARPR